MIDVSIVVPTYNVEKYLSASVNSMLEQTHSNIEIILVDDGSTDSCGKMCDEFALKDNRIKVIHKKNGGLPSARNAGMDAASGKYVYFCDPDDLISRDLIYDNFKLMEENKAEICAFGYNFFVDDGGKYVKEGSYAPPATVCFDYKEFWDNFPMEKASEHTVWCRMFLRSYLVENNIRARNVPLCEDGLFLYDIYECGFNRIVYNSGIYYSYIRRKGGAMSVYRPDRLEITYMLVNRFKEVVEKSDPVKGRYEDLIYRSYVNSALGSFRYLTAVSPFKMYSIVKEYMGRSEVKEGFSRLELQSIKEKKPKFRAFLLKYRMFAFYTIFSFLFKYYKDIKTVLRKNN